MSLFTSFQSSPAAGRGGGSLQVQTRRVRRLARRRHCAVQVQADAVARRCCVMQHVSPSVQAQGVAYAIDPTHTLVISRRRISAPRPAAAALTVKQGTVEFDRAGRTGRVQISIATASVSSGVVALDRRLCAADVLGYVERWERVGL